MTARGLEGRAGAGPAASLGLAGTECRQCQTESRRDGPGGSDADKQPNAEAATVIIVIAAPGPILMNPFHIFLESESAGPAGPLPSQPPAGPAAARTQSR